MQSRQPPLTTFFLRGTGLTGARKTVVDLLFDLFGEGVQDTLKIIVCCHRSFRSNFLKGTPMLSSAN